LLLEFRPQKELAMLEHKSRWLAVVIGLALTQVGFRCDVVLPVTDDPTSSSPIAVDHDDSNVWVVNPDSDTIGKINIASAQLVSEISVGDNPRTLALSRYFGHSRVYVANQDSDSVTRFNDSRFRWFRRHKTTRLPRGSAPYGVAITPDRETLLVTLERTHQLAFISPSTMKVLEVIDVPRTPRGIAIAAAGDVAYLSHFITFEPSNSSVVTEIDIASRSVIRTIELPPDFETCETDASGQGITNLCSTIVLPPTGSPAALAGTVWLGCQRSNNIDKGLLSRSTMMGGQPFPEDNFVGRSRNVFKASFHDIIRSIMVRVDLATEAVEYIDIDDGGLASGIGFSPDGGTGYVTDAPFNFFGVFNPQRESADGPTFTMFGSDSVEPAGSCNGVFNDVARETAFNHFLPPSVELDPGSLPQYADGSTARTGLDPFHDRTIPDGVGTHPIGLAVSSDGARVFTANFLSRNVTVLNATEFVCRDDLEQSCQQNADCASRKCQVVVEAIISSTDEDPLAPEILDGKILFNTAARDASVANDFGLGHPLPPENHDRLEVLEPPGDVVSTSHDGTYFACGGCHPDAGFDGRTWDFSQFGASLRNTMSLVGRASFAPGTCDNDPDVSCVADADCGFDVPLGTCSPDPAFIPDWNPAVAGSDQFFNPMGTIHWNGDRDEVEDFENTVRSLMGSGDCEGSEELVEKCFGGLIMRNSTLEPVDVNADLGAPNRGLGARLNHLADYVYTVSSFIKNPNRDEDGEPLDPAAVRGLAIFNDSLVGCAGCHFGPSDENQQFSDKAQENPFFDPSQTADSRNNPFLRHDVGTANLFDEVDPQVVAVAEDVYHNRPNLSDPNDIIMPASRAPLRAYLTPVLNDVWFTAPYLHDGSAANLIDVVSSCNSGAETCCNPRLDDCTGLNTGRNIDDQHGVTSHLTPVQLEDLVAFLKAPHGSIATDVALGAVAPTLPESIPPVLPEPPEFPDLGPPPTPRGHPGSLAVESLGRFPTGLTLDLLSIGFTFVVPADGLVIDMNIDEEEGVIQFDGSSIPELAFNTPAGPATLFFVPRLVEGTIDHDTGEILIEDLYIGLEFLGTVLPVAMNLSTGTEVLDEFEVTGELLDEESGEVILVGIGLAPAGPLSPPIAIALIIEGVLRGE
jgi:DNA-binding beta-propeller fold protein YncE